MPPRHPPHCPPKKVCVFFIWLDWTHFLQPTNYRSYILSQMYIMYPCFFPSERVDFSANRCDPPGWFGTFRQGVESLIVWLVLSEWMHKRLSLKRGCIGQDKLPKMIGYFRFGETQNVTSKKDTSFIWMNMWHMTWWTCVICCGCDLVPVGLCFRHLWKGKDSIKLSGGFKHVWFSPFCWGKIPCPWSPPAWTSWFWSLYLEDHPRTCKCKWWGSHPIFKYQP